MKEQLLLCVELMIDSGSELIQFSKNVISGSSYNGTTVFSLMLT